MTTKQAAVAGLGGVVFPVEPFDPTLSLGARRRRLRVLQRELDLEAERARPKASCGPGCDACCYMAVEVSTLEAATALHNLRAREGEAGVEHLRARAERRKVEAVGMNRDEYWQARLPCVLLDTITKRCRVYNSRPHLCRTHLAVTDPGLCDIRPTATVAYVNLVGAELTFQRALRAIDPNPKFQLVHHAVLEALLQQETHA